MLNKDTEKEQERGNEGRTRPNLLMSETRPLKELFTKRNCFVRLNMVIISHMGSWAHEIWWVWLENSIFNFYFILTNLKLKTHVCLVAIILDNANSLLGGKKHGMYCETLEETAGSKPEWPVLLKEPLLSTTGLPAQQWPLMLQACLSVSNSHLLSFFPITWEREGAVISRCVAWIIC